MHGLCRSACTRGAALGQAFLFAALTHVGELQKAVLLPKEDSPLWVRSSPEGGGSLERDSSPEGGFFSRRRDLLLILISQNPAAQPATTMLSLLKGDLV